MRMFYRSIALKSDAARYDVAMRTIAGVTYMRLENPQELKAALAILNGQLTHLKLHRSKLITFVLSDYTFANALKEACPNRAAAEALIREWRANPNAVLKLRGAYVLGGRLAESVRADAAILQSIAQAFREYSKIANADRTKQLFYDQDWMGIELITAGIGGILDLVAFETWDITAGLSADMISCEDVAYRQYLACYSLAQSLPELEKDKRRAQCMATALEQIKQCWIPRIRRQLPWGNLPSLK
jgi:hypothetical protein